MDESGRALAAIQGLDQKLNEKDEEIQKLKHQNDLLSVRLNELEITIGHFQLLKTALMTKFPDFKPLDTTVLVRAPE